LALNYLGQLGQLGQLEIMSFSIFCTGSSGLVASDFKRLVLSQNIPFYGLDLHGEDEAVDITKKTAILNFIKSKTDKSLAELKPILFHFAAITLTGNNLTPEQIELSKKVNVEATANLLEVCRELNIPMVHISTDFVFAGGKKDTPYLPEDEISPDNTIYSQTKAEAEREVTAACSSQLAVIIRLAFPYGNFAHPKSCLVRKMLSWMDSKPEVNLYNDQKICPTPISYFSQCCLKVAQLISENKIISGQILHCVGEPTTPYEFGNMIKKVFNKNTNLIPTSVGDGVRSLVLDIEETEKILEMKSLKHRDYLHLSI